MPTTCSNPLDQNGKTCQENEYYNSKVNRCCSNCPPGEYRKSTCTSKKDTVCRTCPFNTYKEEWSNSYECTRCVGTCQDPLRQVQNCTRTTRQICQCKPGMFCKTQTLNYCVQCVEHSLCNAGEFLTEAGTSAVDNVCSPCPSGTFSDVKSVSTKCKPHAKCIKLIKNGTATEDAVCDEPIHLVTSILQFSTNKWNQFKVSTSSPIRVLIHLTTPRVDHLTLSTALPSHKGTKQMVNLLLIIGLVLGFLLILISSSLLVSHKSCFKRLLLSNKTKGSIYIMSPCTVYVGLESGDCVSPDQKDAIAKTPESNIHFPQQESTKSTEESHTFPVEEEGKIFHDSVPAADC